MALAELFISTLGASRWQREPADPRVDYRLEFARGAGDRILNIEVKGSARKVTNPWPLVVGRRFLEDAHRKDALFLLLVADVVDERLYYLWGDSIRPDGTESTVNGNPRLRLQLRPVTKEATRSIRERVMK